jgi:DNA modification methylase
MGNAPRNPIEAWSGPDHWGRPADLVITWRSVFEYTKNGARQEQLLQRQMIEILQANALKNPLANKTVQCCITSPPYWKLRDYGVEGQIGLEPTPELYITHLVTAFREVWRVLRDDGILWLNLGDKYSCEGKNGGQSCGKNLHSVAGGYQTVRNNTPKTGIPAKNLYGIPWRVALALQADGWWLRSDIIWNKPNCMTESVTDRPTKAHEYVFLLSKSSHYFYDADAIREPLKKSSIKRGKYGWNGRTSNDKKVSVQSGSSFKRIKESGAKLAELYNPMGRNKRSVWTIPTQSYSGAHFATFPTKLVEPMILAGTSARGECPVCGLAWRRVVKHKRDDREFGREQDLRQSSAGSHRTINGTVPSFKSPESITTSWTPQCNHDADPVPQLVLDPFAGTATVGEVAIKHRRRFVGLELKGKYIELAQERISGVQIAML